jgi:hypothetical protein
VNEQRFSQRPLRGVYPTNHVTAIFRDLSDAERAAAELRQAGFGENDVVLITSPQAAEIVKHQHQGLLERLRFAVASVVSDEHPFHETYVQAAQEGCHILHVRTLILTEQQLAASVLKDYHGYNIIFFGQWAITRYS